MVAPGVAPLQAGRKGPAGADMAKKRILFVCLGNICRSPLAEGLFGEAVAAQGLQARYEADSAGTNRYHTGELPDPRTRQNAESHGLVLTHRARTFGPADFDEFDLIVCMDQQNVQNVLALARNAADEAKVRLMRLHDPEPGDGQVPDPYFGGADGFEQVYQILQRATLGLLSRLESAPSLKN